MMPGRGYIDDVIMPHSTRIRIARGLVMLRDKHLDMPKRKHENLRCNGAVCFKVPS
jgi:propionyl-CoA carboxylase beta chain